MTIFIKKPVSISAVQWFKNGDHTEDNILSPDQEGEVVKYYRNPDDRAIRVCEKCRHTIYNHGWIDTLKGGHIVCSGDWIITDIAGERYPCNPDIFNKTHLTQDEYARQMSE